MALIRHPKISGDDYRDADGNPPRIVLCPNCGHLEWWTDEECHEHGKCRYDAEPCSCELEEQQRE